VTRAELQLLASDRLADAQALILAQRWSGAYYLAGYAVECGLKSCVLAHVVAHAEVIFQQRRFSEKCWTHNVVELASLADLDTVLKNDCAVNPLLEQNWNIVKDWREDSRYQQLTQVLAQELVDAVADNVNGVLQWIRNHW